MGSVLRILTKLQSAENKDSAKSVEVGGIPSTEPDLAKLLVELQNTKRWLSLLDQTGAQLNERDNPLGTAPLDSPSTRTFIRHSLNKLKLPTCYENPVLFFMLSEYAKDIDRARIDLGMPLPSSVHLGTLPTTEVNAYTYPATQSRGSILAFNTQLFMFAYQMSKVTMPTIDIRRDPSSKRIAVNTSAARALELLKSNPDIRTNYVMAILEFLLLAPPETQPISQSYDPFLITFTEGMEKFAVGHEFGHVIRNHKSPTIDIRLGEDSPSTNATPLTVPVLARSWQQELEADQLGITLLIKNLSEQAKKGKLNDLEWLYSVKGALFFFECLDLVEQAKFIRDRGELPIRFSLAERAYIRAFADGNNTPQQDAKYADLNFKDHPPAWLRLERVQEAIDKELASHPPSSSSEAFAAIADGISDNAQLIWRDVEPRMPILIKALQVQRMHPKRSLSVSDLSDLVRNAGQTSNNEEIPPGCRIDSQHWTETFLCNPQLQDAIVSFQSSTETDAGILGQYHNAIQRDWRLLSGVQVRWAESALKTNKYRDLQIPLSVIALGGDIQSMPALAEIDTSSWIPEDRKFLNRVQQFLSVHGRDTSLKAIQTASAPDITVGDLLCYPKGIQFAGGVEKLVPPETTNAIRTFLRNNSGATIGGGCRLLCWL